MKASDVRPSGNQAEGVGILRAYLEYAATGQLHSGKIDPAAATESPFEDFVKSRLEIRDYEAIPQVGVAGYRIDLGVRHPDYPNGFVLGVECDGATYHSAKSVRDRDRLRQSILEGLGWDIYRIWSTDWFADSDREMAKLLSHLESRIAPDPREIEPKFTQDPSVAADRTILLPGIVLDTPTLEVPPTLDQSGPGEMLKSDDALAPEKREAHLPTIEERETVEIGDLVEYARSDENGPARQVRIVSGPDDPDQGIINDNKPLAIALLGCPVGELTTVEQPTSTLEIIVVRIVKQADSPIPTEPEETTAVSAAIQNDEAGAAPMLSPYPVWNGHRPPDPRNSDSRAVSLALYEIIEVEGPVLVARAFRLYARACNLKRVGRQIRSNLHRALSRLVGENRVTIENENPQQGQLYGIARVSGAERILLRERNSRSFDEIPPSEIAAHLRIIREDLIDPTEEELCRELLDRYGLVRMTQPVRATLARIYCDQL
jgi:very-short-patch-repair endonuclease